MGELDLHELLACPLVCQPPRHSNLIVDGLFVSSARSNLLISRASQHTVCITNEAICTIVPHSEPDFRTCLWDAFCSWVLLTSASPHSSPNGTNSCDGFLPCSHSKIAFSRLDLSGTWMGCCLRNPPVTARTGESFFLELFLACCVHCDI